MTGFKSGASADDPFSDGSSSEDDSESPSSTTTTSSTEAESRAESKSEVNNDREQAQETDESETTTKSSGLPWIYERNSITDGRKKTVQLHLQQSSLDRERDTRLDAEDILGESVKKADLREAALLVGLNHVDEVADQLREWGYDFD